MKSAIENYFKKIRVNSIFMQQDEKYFQNVSKEITEKFDNGFKPLFRNKKSDLSIFKKKYGYDLPSEISDYINIYWHTYISGYCCSNESIILFAVLKFEGDSENDILFYKNGLMDLSNRWEKIGDINKYIPIGWLGYSGGFVVYEKNTGNIYIENTEADIDGILEDRPIAGCLKELINNMDISS